MQPLLTAILFFSGVAFQTPSQQAPPTATPADAPLSSKAAKSAKLASELEGAGGAEDGVMSLAQYEGGSLPFKPNKITLYVNQKEIVLVQGKQRFAIPVKAVTEVSYGNAVSSRVGLAAGIASPTAARKPSAGSPTDAGIIWKSDAKLTAVVLRIDKGDFPNFMQALETVTALKAVNTSAKGR